MATTITDLNITKAEVAVGSAATFRNTINTNFSNYKTEIENKVNGQVKTAITELQSKVGEWTLNGSITAFLGSWQGSWPNTLAGFIGTNYPYGTYGSLTSLLGTGWLKGTWGDMGSRLGGSVTGRRVIIGPSSDNPKNVAKVGDLVCEIGTSS